MVRFTPVSILIFVRHPSAFREQGVQNKPQNQQRGAHIHREYINMHNVENDCIKYCTNRSRNIRAFRNSGVATVCLVHRMDGHDERTPHPRSRLHRKLCAVAARFDMR